LFANQTNADEVNIYTRNALKLIYRWDSINSTKEANQVIREYKGECALQIEKNLAVTQTLINKDIVQCLQCKKCFLPNRWHNPLDLSSEACVHLGSVIANKDAFWPSFNYDIDMEQCLYNNMNELKDWEKKVEQSKTELNKTEFSTELSLHEFMEGDCWKSGRKTTTN